MSDFDRLTKLILEFRDERDWKQFHTPKDMALSLVLEAAEVMEHFQWKNAEEAKEHIRKHKADIGEELADVLFFALIMSYEFGIDLPKAFEGKMKKNAKKYPVAKAKGNHIKYTELSKKKRS